MKQVLLIALLLATLTRSTLADGVATVPQYDIADLPPLPGEQTSQALALNNKGQVVGWSGAYSNTAVIWENGQPRGLLDKAGTWTVASAITDKGDVVGSPDITIEHNGSTLIGESAFYLHGSQVERLLGYTHAAVINAKGTIGGSIANQAALYVSGKWLRLDQTSHYIGSVAYDVSTGSSTVYALNNAGEAVGELGQTHNNIWNSIRVFLWQGDQVSLLETPPTGESIAVAINDLGTIGGAIRTEDKHEWIPVVWPKGEKLHKLGLLSGYTGGVVKCINNAGQVVGSISSHGQEIVTDPPYFMLYVQNVRAVLWQHDAPCDLNTTIPANSGWILESAQAINNLGQIVGYGESNGQMRGYLLTPIVRH